MLFQSMISRSRLTPLMGLKEIPKAVGLSHPGKMQGKLVILIDGAAIENEKIRG